MKLAGAQYFIKNGVHVRKKLPKKTQELDRLNEDLKLEKQKLEKILNFGEKIATTRSLVSTIPLLSICAC